jgi:two-component system cell cycle sensor histidine kinase/response regulator CckA
MSAPSPIVLHVDDNEVNRYIVARTLRSAGYRVLEASSRTHMEKLVRSGLDLMILDINLPDGNGIEICRSLKLNPSTAGMPILLLSATCTERADRAAGLNSGAEAYLTTPVDPAELIATVGSLLRTGNRHRQLAQSNEELELRVRERTEALQRSNEELRRLAEKTASQARFMDAVLGTTADVVVMFDNQQRLTYANAAAVKYFGAPHEEVADNLGQEFDTEIGRQIGPAVREALRTGAELVTEVAANSRTFECVLNPLREANGQAHAVVCVARETTQRKQAEEAVRERERRIRLLVEHQPAVIFRIGPDFCFTSAMGQGWSGLRSSGGQAEQIVGLSITEAFPDSSGQELRSLVERALDGEAVHGDWISRDRVFTLYVQPEHDDHGSAIAALGLALDITDRRRLEQQLDSAQRIEAAGRLAAGVAHDFNNLLAIIRGYLGIFEEELPGRGDSEREAIREISNAVTAASALVGRLLAFSRRQQIHPQRLQLNDVVAGAVRLLRGFMPDDIDLVLKLAPRLPEIVADPHQIERVIINLALNSRDVMPGGGSLLIETSVPDSSDRPPSARSDACLLLKITDTGPGIREDILPHIFEPFITTKGPEEGTGLGLATVHGIVKQSGGDIRAVNRAEGGAAFLIYFPVARETMRAGGG